MVTYVDSDSITPISFNGWSRECTVDKDNASVHPIRGDIATSYIEVVRRTLVSCESCQPRKLCTRESMSLTSAEICAVRIEVVNSLSYPRDDPIESGG